MSEIKFTVNLPSGPTEASILNPFSEHTVPDERGCPDCGGVAYFSGCAVDGCNSYGCQDCGTGCDLDFVDAEDGGRCANALIDEDDDFEDDDREPCGEGSCHCYGVGPDHADCACGCDCPRDDYGQLIHEG